MPDLSPEQREQPTTRVELPSGQVVKTTGPAGVDLQPGAAVQAPGGSGFDFGLPNVMRWVAQGGALGLILLMFYNANTAQEKRFDAATEERKATEKMFQDRLDRMQDREDKRNQREDDMRGKLWSLFAQLNLDVKLMMQKLGVSSTEWMKMRKEQK